MKRLLALLLLVAPTAAMAEHWGPLEEDYYDPGGSASRTCFKSEYKEQYIPGTEYNPGYVKSSKETVEVPCDPDDLAEGKTYQRTVTVYENVDTNDCSDGTIAGALLGGGLAGLPAIQVGPVGINPKASGSYSSNQPYGPNLKEKTVSNSSFS